MEGNFIISLDFELHWGVADKRKVEDYIDYFDTTRRSIPMVLDLFTKMNIHATWATVGYLFAKNKQQLNLFFPKELPSYENKILSNYSLFKQDLIGDNEGDDPYHYAPSLIDLIIRTPNQELGTHTFSHYYCNEIGQTVEQFDLDLKAAQNIAYENFGIKLRSLVFPRNQFNRNYLTVAEKNGIKVVRSNPDVWFWNKKMIGLALVRAFDTLIPVSSTLTFSDDYYSIKDSVVSLPASRFLRPFSNKEKYVQKIKVWRIKKEMTFAAKHSRNYHLWWHPHNFGYSLEKNMDMLQEILSHFKELNEKYGFSSKSMIEMDFDNRQKNSLL